MLFFHIILIDIFYNFRKRNPSGGSEIPASKESKLDTDCMNQDTLDCTSIQISNNEAHSNDIGNFVNAEQLSKDTIKYLLQNIWIPDKNYKFPSYYERNGNRRRFQHNWLALYEWVCYSAVSGKEGAFCLYCVLMGKVAGGRGAQTLGKLVREPLTNYKKAF